LLSVAAGLLTGLNKVAKIGLILLVFGFASIFMARYFYPHFLSPLMGEFADRNFLMRRNLLWAMEVGIWTGVVGAGLVSIGSIIRVWQFRKKLFSSLFSPERRG